MSHGNDAAPELARALGLRSVVLFGLACMIPMIVLGTFGVVASVTGGTVPTAYLLALIRQLIWLGLGVVYLAYLTRMFRNPPPGMAFHEAEGGQETVSVPR